MLLVGFLNDLQCLRIDPMLGSLWNGVSKSEFSFKDELYWDGVAIAVFADAHFGHCSQIVNCEDAWRGQVAPCRERWLCYCLYVEVFPFSLVAKQGLFSRRWRSVLCSPSHLSGMRCMSRSYQFPLCEGECLWGRYCGVFSTGVLLDAFLDWH